MSAAAWPDKGERLFRDWLLGHPAAAAEYAALKLALAGRFAQERAAYTAAKNCFIRTIVNQARLDRSLPPLTDREE